MSEALSNGIILSIIFDPLSQISFAPRCLEILLSMRGILNIITNFAIDKF